MASGLVTIPATKLGKGAFVTPIYISLTDLGIFTRIIVSLSNRMATTNNKPSTLIRILTGMTFSKFLLQLYHKNHHVPFASLTPWRHGWQNAGIYFVFLA